MAAGVLLIAGCVLVVRELVFGGAARALPESGSASAAPKTAEDAAGEEAAADDARTLLAAAARALPQRTQLSADESDDPDRLDAPRVAGRRPPRPGSQRFFLESCRALAAADPVAFEASARECLAKETALAEKVAWLLAARELGTERYDALVDRALDEGRRADPRLRIATVELLERDARRSGAACLRLLRAVALAPETAGADPAERARAASDAFTFAEEAALAAGVTLVQESTDPALRANVLRGLTRNRLPAAAAARERLVEANGWKHDAEQIAATDTRSADESNE